MTSQAEDRQLGVMLVAAFAVWAIVTRKKNPEGKITILDVRQTGPSKVAVDPRVSGLDET